MKVSKKTFFVFVCFFNAKKRIKTIDIFKHLYKKSTIPKLQVELVVFVFTVFFFSSSILDLSATTNFSIFDITHLFTSFCLFLLCFIFLSFSCQSNNRTIFEAAGKKNEC